MVLGFVGFVGVFLVGLFIFNENILKVIVLLFRFVHG